MSEKVKSRKSVGGKSRGNGQVDTEADDSITRDKFSQLFGFALEDLQSYDSFVKLLARPTDPANLALLRVMFGILMFLDIFHERGLGHADVRWGDPDECRFPLFDFLHPLPLEWMYMVYLIMLLGSVGIILGFLFRVSCLMFCVTYWYIFLLDKTVWNNHSYLYGLMSLLLLCSDANRYWSIDGFLFPKIRHSHIPLWNYTLFRTQIFFVYFIAGLKKTDMDWVTGYSMQEIAKHWVFSPFRHILTEDQIGLFIVHMGGFTIDLFMGFFLFFDKTRIFAFIFGSSFHLMNSQIFSIGMFPWTCLATMPLFCYPDWPRKIFRKFPSCFHCVLPLDVDLQTNSHCIYSKEDIKPENKQATNGVTSKSPPPTSAGVYHKVFSVFTVVYILIQCILPYSHGITKGYNNWTNGLYGYSWDMMVHTWKVQHVRVTYVNQDTGEVGYLNPEAWVSSKRWSSHADMAKQYARCISHHLAEYDINNLELYFDIWKSLNDRFQQRMFDPHVDILTADWSPFSQTTWILPLLVDLSDWRKKLDEIEKNLYNSSRDTDVVFVADFPGLYLENFLQEDLNASVTVLQGEVIVELVDQEQNLTLQKGETMQLPANEFHNIHTVSDSPSCYMYIFVNTTDVDYMRNISLYEQIMNGTFSSADVEGNASLLYLKDGPDTAMYQKELKDKQAKMEATEIHFLEKMSKFVNHIRNTVSRSLKFMNGAITSIIFQRPFDDFLNKTYNEEFAARKNRPNGNS